LLIWLNQLQKNFASQSRYGTVTIAEGAPQRVNGRITEAEKPVLGITPGFDVLGYSVLTGLQKNQNDRRVLGLTYL
jgi:hypothetical protein|tara:strand:- start:559 stop:786 length:228 start_codon:yes stop_codon:yes gene_type:complete